MFKKVLIANRGEIALRILRACKELGIACVAVHSTADSEAMHVRLADESVCIGPPPAQESYLNIANILTAAEVTNADAIHPGFGFLSENAKFASLVQQHGLTFIGPSPEHIAMMGDKVQAKQKAKELGLTVVPGSEGAVGSMDEAFALAHHIGYPVLIKASAGGGGRGMRLVHREDQLEEELTWAKAEAAACFGDDTVYMEKFLVRPRHIELQILGDHHGNVVCLAERDCSLQRRHQKIWEEAPALLPAAEREALIEAGISAMKKFGYVNAGTLEFLYEAGKFYFIEMNTRIQVEHPVTEMITGIDIVKAQIEIAAGQPLPFTQQDIQFSGHAIECRINAENAQTFAPSPGKIEAYLPPGGPFVRVDSGLFPGYIVPPYYDSLVAKLVVYGHTRQECLKRLKRALDEYAILGIDTLIPLHQRLCETPEVISGDYDIKWLERFLDAQKGDS